MNLQDMFDAMGERMQRERADSQMTLGDLIEVLEEMPEDAEVLNISRPHSYRGYYGDLAFILGDGVRTAGFLLAECRKVMGKALTGYKGGKYVMGELTPVWIANYGSTGDRLISIAEGGEYISSPEEM